MKGILIGFVSVFYFTSCVNTKQAYYFADSFDTSFVIKNSISNETLLQKNDLLSIHISSLNSEASAVFNTPNDMATVATTTSGHQEAGGYLVDAEGFIQIPLLGKIQAAGLTKSQLKKKISDEIISQQLLSDPVVTIRYLNFEVTIIGEVGKPTVVNVPNEKISLLKALGMAGDITIYGKKDYVMLLRDQGGKRVLKRLNLNSKEFLHSDFYFLQPNDIVYVEPNKQKIVSSSGSPQMWSIVLGGLSLIAIILTNLLK